MPRPRRRHYGIVCVDHHGTESGILNAAMPAATTQAMRSRATHFAKVHAMLSGHETHTTLSAPA